MIARKTSKVLEIAGTGFVLVIVLCLTSLMVAGTYSLVVNLFGYCK